MPKFQVGDKNPYIADIQQALNEKLGANGPSGLPTKKYMICDGEFGPKTRDCLMAYQSSIGIPASGIYDLRTAAALDPYIAQRFLTEEDYVRGAQFLGVDVASVKTITDVESKGCGFFGNGKPVILFERHQFRNQMLKMMKASTPVASAVSTALGIAVPVTGPNISLIDQTMQAMHPDIYHESAGGYLGGIDEYKRLDKAKTFNSTCAIAAASWGLFQIMGFNYKVMGFSTVEMMVEENYPSEDNQLLQFCKFIKANNNILVALRNKDWVAFALAYNGPNMRINKYDEKLKAAYSKHSLG